MGKVRENYMFLKNQDDSKRYLFKNGVFYIFLDDDALVMSEKYNLKLVSFGLSRKCGFPASVFERYIEKFKDDNVVVVSDDTIACIADKIVDLFNEADINNLTPLAAFDLVKKVKDVVKNG